MVAVAGWVLAEFVRITSKCPPSEAQLVVDSLAERRIPLIWQRGSVIRVLDPKLGFKEKTLAVLYHLEPIAPSDKELFEAVEYSTLRKYRSNVLGRLHEDALIDFRHGSVILLPPGKRIVERDVLPQHTNLAM